MSIVVDAGFVARGPDDFPATSAAAGRILSLPMYPEIGQAGVRDVVSAVSDYYRSS